ncbi:MAG: hypothetical protein OXG78_11395 [Chloroflexi bacterium]|nr:hypothetical protein [Chloroflexota bacterium]
MTAERNEDRYEDILKKIAERRPFGRKQRETRPLTPHERVLNLINAYDCLAELSREGYAQWLCHGPKSLRGSAWAGVVAWAHRKGYHGYQSLNLHGVWAHYVDDEIRLSIGIRTLPYNAPVYDAGVYRVAIQSNFRIYYDDSGRPPYGEEPRLYGRAFKEEERLQHRQALIEIVKQWRGQLAAG